MTTKSRNTSVTGASSGQSGGVKSISDLAAERGVLAGVFRYGADAYLDIADLVTERTFLLEQNQVLWKCASHILGEHPQIKQLDYPSIMSAAHSLGLSQLIEKSDDVQHIRSIMKMPIELQSTRLLAGSIRKLEIARLLDEQLAQARRDLRDFSGAEPIDEILSSVEKPIFDLTSLLTSPTGGARPMGEGVEDYVQFLIDNPREMIGISTGFPRYDMCIGGGLRPNSMDIIGARLKVGKTQLVDNIALHIAGKVGVPVLNIDTEMSLEEHRHRILANLADVEVREIENGKFGRDPAATKRVRDAAKRLNAMPYYYDCVIGKPFEEIMSSMRRWVTRVVGTDDNGKAKPCVVLYDYLKLMSGESLNRVMQEYQALGFIATGLKNFMGRYGVASLCFVQLNREGIDREDTDVVGGSDRIAQYGTSLTLYKWKTDEEKAEADSEVAKYTHKLIPIVSRHGEGLRDGDYINMMADYKRGRITEGPTRNEVGHVSRQQQGEVVNDAIDFASV